MSDNISECMYGPPPAFFEIKKAADRYGLESEEPPRLRLSLGKRMALELHRLKSEELAEKHPLRTLFWECTQRCNLSCRHCGSDCRVQSDYADMPADDFLKVVDSIMPHVDPHSVNIVITGGEPLMRGDLEEVGLQLYRRGFPWGIVTNGLALTRERLLSLRKAGIHMLTISIDGLAPDHTWMRGNPRSFDAAVKAASMVAEAGDIVWDVVTCVNSRNISTLPQLKELLIGAGVRKWRIFTVFPAGRAATEKAFRLSGEEYRSLLDFIKASRAEGRINVSYCCEGFLGEYEGEVRDRFMRCHAGVTVGSVLIDGSIGACPSIRSIMAQGNIYDDDFMTVWNTRYEDYRNREKLRTGICARCKAFRYCKGNGLHLRDEDGLLMRCNLKELQS